MSRDYLVFQSAQMCSVAPPTLPSCVNCGPVLRRWTVRAWVFNIFHQVPSLRMRGITSMPLYTGDSDIFRWRSRSVRMSTANLVTSPRLCVPVTARLLLCAFSWHHVFRNFASNLRVETLRFGLKSEKNNKRVQLYKAVFLNLCETAAR